MKHKLELEITVEGEHSKQELIDFVKWHLSEEGSIDSDNTFISPESKTEITRVEIPNQTDYTII